MNAIITAYIAFRYPNWMDYAHHQCRVHKLESWECDLMNDIIADLMSKPESKLADLMSRETRKIVNGRPTTELDKFVLFMIKQNARSKFASFRKNTVGQKIITTGACVEVATFCELSEATDPIDETTYNAERAQRLDRMHTRNIKLLKRFGYSAEAIEMYIKHYIEGRKPTKSEETHLLNIQNFLSHND